MEAYRSIFYGLRSHIYLATCSHSPLWEGIDRALMRYRDDLLEFGNPWELWMDKMEYSKSLFASLIGAKKSEVAIGFSVSSSLSALMSAMKYAERNEIIVSDLEYPTTNFIFLAQEAYGARVRTLKHENYRILPDQYEKIVGEKTKLVSAVHVSSLNGFKQNIKEIARIAHNAGAYIYTDVYQSLGTMPIDVKKYDIDFLTSGTLKWLLGIPGVSYLYVREELIEGLKPTSIGWFSQKNPFLFGAEKLDYADSADRFQSGTWCVPGVYAAIEGMELIKRIGPENIESTIKRLTSHAIDYASSKGLKTITPENAEERGAIVSLVVDDPHDVEKKLKKAGIITSARDIGLRISPHFYNTKEEIEEAIDKILALSKNEGKSAA